MLHPLTHNSLLLTLLLAYYFSHELLLANIKGQARFYLLFAKQGNTHYRQCIYGSLNLDKGDRITVAWRNA